MMSRQAGARRGRRGGRRSRKQHIDDVEFSAEDASRSDRDYLVEGVRRR